MRWTAPKRTGARRILLFLCLLLLTGCASLLNTKPDGPWYNAYQPIEDPDSEAFIATTLEMAKAEFGEPAIPIRQILLRRSRKTKEARRYRIGEDFSLTECVDPTNGVFAIYIGVDPDHSNYHALLAHECFHLLNPYITDWYVEGMATAFSEQACADQGLVWGDWKRHFVRSRREPYALSYRMMLELREAFPGPYAQLLRFTRAGESGEGPWLRIDIDRWIDSLPPDRRDEAREIIDPYTEVLRKYTSKMYGFAVPTPE